VCVCVGSSLGTKMGRARLQHLHHHDAHIGTFVARSSDVRGGASAYLCVCSALAPPLRTLWARHGCASAIHICIPHAPLFARARLRGGAPPYIVYHACWAGRQCMRRYRHTSTGTFCCEIPLRSRGPEYLCAHLQHWPQAWGYYGQGRVIQRHASLCTKTRSVFARIRTAWERPNFFVRSLRVHLRRKKLFADAVRLAFGGVLRRARLVAACGARSRLSAASNSAHGPPAAISVHSSACHEHYARLSLYRSIVISPDSDLRTLFVL